MLKVIYKITSRGFQHNQCRHLILHHPRRLIHQVTQHKEVTCLSQAILIPQAPVQINNNLARNSSEKYIQAAHSHRPPESPRTLLARELDENHGAEDEEQESSDDEDAVSAARMFRKELEDAKALL